MRNMIPNSQPEAKDHEVNVNGGQALCVVDPGKDSHLPSGRGGDQDFRGGGLQKVLVMQLWINFNSHSP